ncbi:MAG TPA: ABC transporter permease [Actinomycetota bacterium]|nr:ABC transporter permease [Actinomycetota bacterium]
MAQTATDLSTSYQVGGPPDAESGAVVARSPRQLFWARFKEDKLAIAGGVAIVIMIALALTADLWANITGHPFDQLYKDRLDVFGIPTGPDSEFWFGADDLGRDLFVRMLYGARVSLRIAFIATGVEVVIGVLAGLFSGFRGGAIDVILSRIMDLVLSIPFLLLGIALAVAVGASEGLVIFIIVFFGWPYIARIVRGQVLSLREAQFVEAARSLGASSGWIMFREILPNLVAPVLTYATLIIPVNILAEAALSFLGVGIQEPTPAWGTMLDRATQYAANGEAWWYMVFPGAALFITVLGFNLLGDGLRDALDPRTGR